MTYEVQRWNKTKGRWMTVSVSFTLSMATRQLNIYGENSPQYLWRLVKMEVIEYQGEGVQ